MPTDPRPTLDEMLRRFLDADPGDALARLRLSVERCVERIEAHTIECERYRKETDERFRRLEHPSARPPTMGDLGKLVTSTGSWDTGAIDKVISDREAKAALNQKQALYRGAGKVALAVVSGAALVLAGKVWSDISAPRPATNSTSITTIAPGTLQR